MPNILRDEAHMYANQGTSMVAQHKSLLDVTGAGIGWIIANSTRKAKIRNADPAGVCKDPPTAASIPSPAPPAATLLWKGTEHIAAATIVWSKPISSPPGLVVTIRCGKCITSK